MKLKFEWEIMTKSPCYTSRAKVIGGWIVNMWNKDGDALVFIPGPEHKWEIE